MQSPSSSSTARADALLARLGTSAADCLTHVHREPRREAQAGDWPRWVPASLRAALRGRGIEAPYAHQQQAAEAAWHGEHVVLATGTASGKSLAYQLPVASALLADDAGCALYLAPTKALAADQLRVLTELQHGESPLPDLDASRIDGDTAAPERDWARRYGRWLITNPDMLHHSLLPAHQRWSRVFRRLRYVVIDECHRYRGVFGSQVALVLRRLRRIAAHYGSSPVFLLASATVADPGTAAGALIGAPVRAITTDGSPRAGRVVAFWEPPLQREVTGENGAPVRRSAGAEAGRMLADLVVAGARSVAFVRSRNGAELTAAGARRALREVDPALAERVAAYRAGLLPEERRAVEAQLQRGRLLAAAATSALELGVDIAGLDAVLIAGYPGTVAALWQQAGRAGRGDKEALVVFIARDDPLDTYLVHHPDAVLQRPVEGSVIDPSNPYVLGPQLCCAAAELPIREPESGTLGGVEIAKALTDLQHQRLLRRRPAGWYWTRTDRPHGDVALRGGGEQVTVVESETARMLGTVAPDAAPATVFPGAVYLHQGSSYVIDELDLASGIAFAHPEEPDYYTQPRQHSDISVLAVQRSEPLPGGVSLHHGTVRVTSRVVGFLRRLPSGEVVEQVPLDVPEQSLVTAATWYCLPEERAAEHGLTPADLPGALHAAEHAAIGLLPLLAGCDRWDIGGVSTAQHPDTEAPTVFVHDGHPGGSGFAERGFRAFRQWLEATRQAIAGCECAAGCPSCVQSPKCGNGNQPLDKLGGQAVLAAVTDAIARANVPVAGGEAGDSA